MKIKIAYAKSNNEVIVRIFEIDPNETVSSLKNKIMGDSHIPTKNQVLFFASTKPLEDHRKLSDYNIIADDLVIRLMTKAQLEKSDEQPTPQEKKSITDEKPKTVIIQTMAGATTKLECQGSDTMLTLKKKYQEATGIPVKGQRFLCNGRVLKNTEPLDNHQGILNGSLKITMTQIQKPIEESKKISESTQAPTQTPPVKQIPLPSQIGFWLAGKHTKKAITAGTGAGAGLGYLALQENIGLLSLAVGAGAGLFITLLVGNLIRCAIPQGQWGAMQEQERQSTSVVGP